MLDASTMSKESPSYQDLEENLTVVSVVELVAGGVQELVDGIFNNPNEAVYQNEAILMIRKGEYNKCLQIIIIGV